MSAACLHCLLIAAHFPEEFFVQQNFISMIPVHRLPLLVLVVPELLLPVENFQ